MAWQVVTMAQAQGAAEEEGLRVMCDRMHFELLVLLMKARGRSLVVPLVVEVQGLMVLEHHICMGRTRRLHLELSMVAVELKAEAAELIALALVERKKVVVVARVVLMLTVGEVEQTQEAVVEVLKAWKLAEAAAVRAAHSQELVVLEKESLEAQEPSLMVSAKLVVEWEAFFRSEEVAWASRLWLRPLIQVSSRVHRQA